MNNKIKRIPYLRYPHLRKYNFIRIKRFLIQTILAFIFQYMTIMALPLTLPALPLYPPIGIAFILFYLLGSNAIFGLFLGEALALFLKGMPIESIILYLIADLGLGVLGAHVCQNTFSKDVKPFSSLNEVLKFIGNIAVICIVSSLIRMGVLWFTLAWHNQGAEITSVTQFNTILVLLNFVNFWFADFNAIMMLSLFIFSWITVPFSRIRISNKSVNIPYMIGLIVLFALVSAFFVVNPWFAYVLLLAMIFAVFMAYYYGYLIGTLILFVISSLYLSHFIVLKPYYVTLFGLSLYTFTGIILFLFIIDIMIMNLESNQKPR